MQAAVSGVRPAPPPPGDREARRLLALAAYESAHARRAAEGGGPYERGVAYASAARALGLDPGGS